MYLMRKNQLCTYSKCAFLAVKLKCAILCACAILCVLLDHSLWVFGGSRCGGGFRVIRRKM